MYLLCTHNAFPVLFKKILSCNKQSADSRPVLFYVLPNVWLPQMFLSIFAVHFYRLLFHVMSYYTCLIIFYFAWLIYHFKKVPFLAFLLILFTYLQIKMFLKVFLVLFFTVVEFRFLFLTLRHISISISSILSVYQFNLIEYLISTHNLSTGYWNSLWHKFPLSVSFLNWMTIS